MRGVLARGQRLVFRGEPLAGPATLSDATAYVNDIQAGISEARRFLTHAFLMKSETVLDKRWL